MNILYLDPFSGISGDMFLGLMVDLGVDLQAIEAGLSTLPIQGWQLRSSRQQRRGITGTKVDVLFEESHHHRTWADIDRMLAQSPLPVATRELARRIFRRVGIAEAKVHGVDLADVHFHEVGAIDSIVDIVGAAIALEQLPIDKILCGPLPMSHGTVHCAHGAIPLPAPATLEILQGLPIVDGRCDKELVTPTGAAIVAEIARFAPLEAMTVVRTGYGVGSRDLADRPNLLRGILGRTAAESSAESDYVGVLESHLDDINPEWLGALMERLLVAGALDVAFSPLQMKKNRPGVGLTVVVPAARSEELAALLLRESSASGVRLQQVRRLKLPREQRCLDTALGPAEVKLFYQDGRLLRVTPEFDSCQRLAQSSGLPLPEVYRLVERAADHLFSMETQ
ncbi:nickel pincer cofactor biosynthesis protein LarC [Desulfuromonas sp. AOP6]|uniref:nickel pincer cofactor biosynthesis protein LarC n=1 Tax=Desulfuromonas sp. AOP6 TaxID=1566351 RepID=UPI00126CE11A|nr:nickel pincer cofactor biosynthesis protein LarC [Desulfuromonas sp. AOP6]BCA78798.1 UPF0272 protein [Desulfuromonas sp. AOP6]